MLGLRHFDVQLVGGMVLHEGKIAEMKTGEGKTLVATLPVYLNALSGKGVHVVTVNDYLASRDAEWMGRIYRFLGLTTGVIVHGLTDEERRAAYAADVTYGTNNEFGFDYLRDNMKYRLEEMVQRDFNYAIVDEVDSILIDEARTPLIISGPSEDSSDLYRRVDEVVKVLVEDKTTFDKDEKQRTANLTDTGSETVEEMLRDRGDARGGQPLRLPQRDAGPPREPVAAGACAVLEGCRLHRPRRQGRHHRRVHRPHDGGPALLRRPAPGAGGEGARHRPAGEPDPRQHHLPELFPALSRSWPA